MTLTATADLDVHRKYLWAICYRMTGSAADADDLVQDTFVRAIERPPARLDEPWRPWLVRVAMNLARDLLRRRRRMAYTGPWLPGVVDTGEDASPAIESTLTDGGAAAARYDRLESVSFAFLLALEALTPQQRAVLILRDVFDYSVREAAEALALSTATVKTTHHRARRAMAEYDRRRLRPMRELQQRTRSVLERFLAYVRDEDVAGLESLLAADVKAVSDGGGEFRSALRPVVGADKVIRFFLAIAPEAATLQFRTLNGLPAAIIDPTGLPDLKPPLAPRSILQVEIDEAGRVTSIYVVTATRKLAGVSGHGH